jgi:proteic killer suppression protein
MIKTYASKALEAFATEGDGSRLPIRDCKKAGRVLSTLDAATMPEDMQLPGFRFHGLNTLPKRYAVDASRNYQITWTWENGHALDVDIEVHHQERLPPYQKSARLAGM